jgi:hypothetical protein
MGKPSKNKGFFAVDFAKNTENPAIWRQISLSVANKPWPFFGSG